MVHKLYEIKPRSIVYLFSGGKDSSLALLMTRDIVRKYAEESKARVYIVHITLAGNTHPLNVYASATVMYWHKRSYGFEPVFLTSNKVFQEYMARYGLMVGAKRWCYQEFKNKLIVDFEKRLVRPVVEIDGMKPSDSKHRSDLIKEEFQYVERVHSGFKFWAWHPLINFTGNPLDELRKHDEFKPIVTLYEKFGDSLNCVLCPYKNKTKLIKYRDAEDFDIMLWFMDEVMTSRKWRKRFSFLKNKPLEVIEW